MMRNIKLLSGNQVFTLGAYHAGMKVKKLGNVRTLDIFMLGGVSILMPFKESVWQECIAQHLPAKIRAINDSAFDAGRKEMQHVYC